VNTARDDLLDQRKGARSIWLGVRMTVDSTGHARQLPYVRATMTKPDDVVLLGELLRHHEPGDRSLDLLAWNAFCDCARDKHATLDLRPSLAFRTQPKI